MPLQGWVEIGKGIAAAVAPFLEASISFPSATPAAVSTATVTPTNPAPAVSPPFSPQPYVAHTSNEVLVNPVRRTYAATGSD